MDLEMLQDRRKQLITSIDATTQSLYMLHGHKAELDYQIELLVQELHASKADETVVEPTPAVE